MIDCNCEQEHKTLMLILTGALLTKTYKIERIFTATNFARVVVSNGSLVQLFLTILLGEVVLLFLFQVLFVFIILTLLLC